jgi:aminopeptidase-like protein
MLYDVLINRNRANIMTYAWSLVKQGICNFRTAMRRAWQVAKLMDKLHSLHMSSDNTPFKISFKRKEDGSLATYTAECGKIKYHGNGSVCLFFKTVIDGVEDYKQAILHNIIDIIPSF